MKVCVRTLLWTGSDGFGLDCGGLDVVVLELLV